jgi:hypothetical protein
VGLSHPGLIPLLLPPVAVVKAGERRRGEGGEIDAVLDMGETNILDLTPPPLAPVLETDPEPNDGTRERVKMPSWSSFGEDPAVLRCLRAYEGLLGERGERGGGGLLPIRDEERRSRSGEGVLRPSPSASPPEERRKDSTQSSGIQSTLRFPLGFAYTFPVPSACTCACAWSCSGRYEVELRGVGSFEENILVVVVATDPDNADMPVSAGAIAEDGNGDGDVSSSLALGIEPILAVNCDLCVLVPAPLSCDILFAFNAAEGGDDDGDDTPPATPGLRGTTLTGPLPPLNEEVAGPEADIIESVSLPAPPPLRNPSLAGGLTGTNLPVPFPFPEPEPVAAPVESDAAAKLSPSRSITIVAFTGLELNGLDER